MFEDIMNWNWYRIPGYNGYEYNFENKIVRSIKNFNVNPMGRLIKKYSDGSGDFYKMSNMHNEVEKVYINEIEALIKEDPLKRALPTSCTNMGSRNIVTRKKKNYKNDPMTETYFPDFDDMIINQNDL